MPRYNLALIPVSQSKEIIGLVKKFSHLADKYLLDENSLPHVTLYQFEANKNEIDGLWQQISKIWKEYPIDLKFKEFSCLTFDNSTYWVSLLPDNCDKLHKMHLFIADAMNLSANKFFDPHMTLISTKNSEYEKEVEKIWQSYVPILDSFILALGKSDDIGQFIEIVYKY